MSEKRINVRMSAYEHQQLKLIAVKNNTTMNDILSTYIREIIKKELSNEKK